MQIRYSFSTFSAFHSGLFVYMSIPLEGEPRGRVEAGSADLEGLRKARTLLSAKVAPSSGREVLQRTVKAKITVQGAFIRENPVSGGILKSFDVGTIVNVGKRHPGNAQWYQIEYNGLQGWMRGDQFEKFDSRSENPHNEPNATPPEVRTLENPPPPMYPKKLPDAVHDPGPRPVKTASAPNKERLGQTKEAKITVQGAVIRQNPASGPVLKRLDVGTIVNVGIRHPGNAQWFKVEHNGISGWMKANQFQKFDSRSENPHNEPNATPPEVRTLENPPPMYPKKLPDAVHDPGLHQSELQPKRDEEKAMASRSTPEEAEITKLVSLGKEWLNIPDTIEVQTLSEEAAKQTIKSKLNAAINMGATLGLKEWAQKRGGDMSPNELNREKKKRLEAWTDVLFDAMKFANIPMTNVTVKLLCNHMIMESGGNVVGKTNGKNLLKQLKSEYSKYIPALTTVSLLDAEVKIAIQNVETKLQAVSNEKELYEWTQYLLGQMDMAKQKLNTWRGFPFYDEISTAFEKAVEKLSVKPATLGPFQVNVDNLKNIMESDLSFIASHPQLKKLLTGDGAKIDRDKLARSLLNEKFETNEDDDTLSFPVAVSAVVKYYIRPIYASNSVGFDINQQDREFIFADFHNGHLTSRNAAIQNYINKALKEENDAPLILDGDIVLYTNSGMIDKDHNSKTQLAIQKLIEKHIPRFQKSALEIAKKISYELSEKMFPTHFSAETYEFLGTLRKITGAENNNFTRRIVPETTVDKVGATLRNMAISTTQDYVLRGQRYYAHLG